MKYVVRFITVTFLHTIIQECSLCHIIPIIVLQDRDDLMKFCINIISFSDNYFTFILWMGTNPDNNYYHPTDRLWRLNIRHTSHNPWPFIRGGTCTQQIEVFFYMSQVFHVTVKYNINARLVDSIACLFCRNMIWITQFEHWYCQRVCQ